MNLRKEGFIQCRHTDNDTEPRSNPKKHLKEILHLQQTDSSITLHYRKRLYSPPFPPPAPPSRVSPISMNDSTLCLGP